MEVALGEDAGKDELQISGDDIDFSGIDEDLEQFQQDDIVRQALLQGVDLRGYARDIDLELREIESDSVQEYGNQSTEVIALHHQIQGCDAILARMQEMLLGFQADLGGISDEIKHLQDESISMNIKLKNLRSAEEDLGNFLGNVLVTSELSTSVCGDEVNDAFLEHVVELNNKIKYIGQTHAAHDGSSLDMAPSTTMAAKGVRPHLDNLKAKACGKARDYLLQKIGELRKPKTNVQIIQKNSLLKYKYLMQFMCDNAPEAAEEIRVAYIESMGRTIAALFRAYHAQLMKLELEMANRHDLIAVEDAAARNLFSANKVDPSKRDGFNMGDRDKILDAIEAGPILVHVAVAEGSQFPYEAIMRSVFKHLMDSATSEYLFTIEFFKGQSKDTFNKIFSRTLSLCIENLEHYLSTCWDCIGLLLMIKIAHALSMIMQRRRVPVLDSFFDRVNMLLWPRFKTVFDVNLKSVKTANAKRLGTNERHPHNVTTRYAHFAASLLALHSGLDDFLVGIGGEEMLLNDLATLRVEVVQLVQRMADQLPSNKLQVVFLINNYHEVLSIFQERRIISDETARFEELLGLQRDFFVEEELKEKYRRLISFVQQTEKTITSGESSSGADLDEAVVEGLVREFAASWKNGIEFINQDVLSFFSNRNGMEILKQVLTQLLLYYTRFQEIIRKSWRRPPAFTKDLVSTSAILSEIKKYSRSY